MFHVISDAFSHKFLVEPTDTDFSNAFELFQIHQHHLFSPFVNDYE